MSVSETMNNPLIIINSMNTKHISLAFAAAAALLAGCAKSPIETPSDTKGLTDLELTHVGSTEVKSVIDGTDFPTEGEIGLFLFTDEAATTPYGETGYTNVKYAYNSTKGKWTANPSIKVGSTPGYLYGYYPYSSESTDVKEIPVVSSLNGNDVMYATPVKEVTDQTASQTSITMNHALARVCITVVNKGYTGNAKLSKIKLSGAEIAPEGTLNALDGSVTATKSDVTLDVTGDAQAITAAGTTYECLLVPSAVISDEQTVDLTLTIDGEDKTATLSGNNGVIIAKGTKSNITIGLSNSGISVSSVSIDEWKEVEVGGHKVTVKRSSEDGIDDDVFLDVTSNGSNVTIKSHSALTGRRTSCTCTPAGKAACTPSIDATTGICTFTITDVQDDITAEVGYMKCNVTVVYDSDFGTVKVNGANVASGYTVQSIYGDEVQFLAEAKSGYGFVRWTNSNGETLSTDNPYEISQITSDITLKAVFGYQITAEVKPAGTGTVTGAGIYAYGSTVTLTATAGGSGWTFIGWAKKDSPGTIISTNNQYSFTVSGPASYVAVFDLTDALPGLFTVNSSGTQVRFSKGNLWCDGTGEGYSSQQPVIKSWGFESNQYDSTPQTRDGSRSTEHISHFLWCKSASESVKETYSETGTGTNDKFFTDNDDFAVNGVSSWRTLTRGSSGEWAYLLNSRTGNRFAKAKINGMAGLLIFPDNYTGTTEGQGIAEVNSSTAGYPSGDNSDIPADTWTSMQNAGAVFLPAAGFRDGNPGSPYPARVNDVGDHGFYWSASPIDDYNAFDLYFFSGIVFPDDAVARNRAQSVRLVTESK